MFKSRFLRFSVVLLGFVLAGPGCKKADSKSGTEGKPLKEVRIGYFANVTHAQGVLGYESGDFARALAPVEVKPQVFNAGPSLIELLLTGHLDIGYVGPGPAISAYAKDPESIRVIAGAAANGVLIVARKDSGISKLEDLKGRRIATPQTGNTQDIAAKHYVTQVLKQSDFKNVIPIANAEQAARMEQKEIDAAWVPEPWGSRLIKDAGAVLIGKEEDLWPDKKVNLTVIITTAEFMKKHPDVVEKVLKVHAQWTKNLSENPTKYGKQLNDALAKLTSKRLPDDVIDSSLKNVLFTNEPLDQTLSTMAQWAFELEFLTKKPKLDKLVDLTALKSVEKVQ